MTRADDARVRWGLPDWRDPAGYPFNKSTPPAQWRWQWLRRRPSYRNAWERAADRARRRGGVLVAEADFPIVAQMDFGPAELIWPGQQLSDGQAESLVPPVIGRAPLVVDWVSQDVGQEIARDGIRLLAFNVNLPIGPQIKAAKAALADMQSARAKEFSESWARVARHFARDAPKIARDLAGRAAARAAERVKAERPQPRKWPLYLRVLDARTCGASYGEIARVLRLNSDQTVRAAIDAAENIQARPPQG
jgi:hypothetical protein